MGGTPAFSSGKREKLHNVRPVGKIGIDIKTVLISVGYAIYAVALFCAFCIFRTIVLQMHMALEGKFQAH
jgi:hypothetical protein